MATRARFTEQMPFVGTEDQRAVIEKDAEVNRVSLADCVRAGLNLRYGLTEDGELPEGVTVEQAVKRAVPAL